ncbi:MAG: sn-glycerol-3-phosphate ABC transporter ATP-binding protein UgpC [Verrucomicrobia bacterium]|jgi:multiple sugar transport system ATP-binding protein|nr:sn-glycerol-3-phosphate ABC transporter ATP-binding protein UgpC [Verrucomicrobiota bacterium]MBT7065812.1 sn-glycerol-3-phosphate ABC transporter ATP-binding protein UgpC [Verrucomicrobiota bacterium]MBT7700278.1 sn-glycerol-3-phosphate ABC transporter ATP-binding protein UgpC [Verrucomicrobiota bacterium]
MANVSLENVYKVYAGNVTAVKDFSLEITHGEFLVLVGPSGCGKSTTLRMIAGLEEISDGTVKIGERIVNDVPPKDRDIAMVFQNYALYPHMTVYDNMAFGLKLRKFKKAEIQKRVEEAANILGLDAYLERRPKALSGGQRQRVAMGRAIVREPAVFLFDEPLSNLDAKMRVGMRKEILHLHRRLKTTMVYVTHDQVEAMTLGDRICVMRDGIIEQVGEPTTVFDHPATLFVAGFIGAPPMNIFEGQLLDQDGTLVFDGGSVKAPIAKAQYDQVRDYVGKKVCVGLRPKAFALKGEGDAPVSFTGEIEVSEMLGEEVLAHLKCGEHQFTVSLDPHAKGINDGKLTVCPDMERAHVFDIESGKNLTMPK